MNKIYFTNNTVENINSKINYYLPKKITNNVDFVNSISKIIINSKFTKNEVIRKDYITRSIISIIKKFKLNETPRWISYSDFKLELVNIILNNDDNIKDNDVELLFNILNGLNNIQEEFFDLDNINIKNKTDYLKDNKKNASISESNLDIEGNDECNSSEDKFVGMSEDEIDDNCEDLKIIGSMPIEDIENDKENKKNFSKNDISLLLEQLSNTHINNSLSSDSESNLKLKLKERLNKILLENKPIKRKSMYPKDSFSSEDSNKNDIKLKKRCLKKNNIN